MVSTPITKPSYGKYDLNKASWSITYDQYDLVREDLGLIYWWFCIIWRHKSHKS